MSEWLDGKCDDEGRPTCPRCGAPSSETAVLCERHRLDAAARQSRWSARRRPLRRRLHRCAFCKAPSSMYRCERCQAKRRRWDVGEQLGDLAAPAAAQQEIDFGRPAARLDAPRDEDSRSLAPPCATTVVSTLRGAAAIVQGGEMSNEHAGAGAAVSIEDLEQRTLRAIQEAIDGGDHERAHCLAETHEALVRARTLDHQAMKVAAERALRQLEDARARATPNAAVPKSGVETA